MSKFPNLTKILTDLIPTVLKQNFSSTIKNRAYTQISPELYTQRHIDHQGGLTSTQDGEVSLRAGRTLNDHSVGASLSMTADGHSVLTAPAGLVLAGTLHTQSSPTDALSFSSGLHRFNPELETTPLLCLIIPDPTVLDKYFVSDTSNTPATIPLSDVFQIIGLYSGRPPGE